MKRILTMLALAAVLLTSLLAVSCKYKKIEDLVDIEEEKENNVQTDYGNYDYSLKPYFSTYIFDAPVVYQNNAYFLNSYVELCYVSLAELEKDMTTYVRENPSEYVGLTHYHVCPSNDHNHGTMNINVDCPGWVGGSNMQFLLDAYESGGSYPVIYYAHTHNWLIDENPWERMEPYVLYRYDTGSNTREALAEFTNSPVQMMSYGEYLYIVMWSAVNSYELYEIHKSTKEVHTLALGTGRIELIYADGEFIYVSGWTDGTLYRVGRELQTSEPIFTPPELVTVSEAEETIGMFIDNGYIYYRADYEEIPMWINDTQTIEPFRYNIRRVSLDNPQGEGELVAEGIFELCDFGIAGNKFYFTPMDYGEKSNDYYYNFNNGRFCVVDLMTLETTDVVSDSGLLFEGGENDIISERYIISHIRPIADKGYDLTMNDGATYFTLYDFETGALYQIYAT